MTTQLQFIIIITIIIITVFVIIIIIIINVVGPCHHGMVRPQVADRGTASDKEGSCE